KISGTRRVEWIMTATGAAPCGHRCRRHSGHRAQVFPALPDSVVRRNDVAEGYAHVVQGLRTMRGIRRRRDAQRKRKRVARIPPDSRDWRAVERIHQRTVQIIRLLDARQPHRPALRSVGVIRVARIRAEFLFEDKDRSLLYALKMIQ